MQGHRTYGDDIVGIGAMEIWYPYTRREGFLTLKSLIETLAKLWLYAQRLQHKDAHAHQALLGRVISLIDCIVQYQHHEVVGPVCIDNERAETLVAL